MNKLLVARNGLEVEELFKDMYTAGKPAFQAGPEVPLEDVRAALEHQVQDLGFEGFTFNTTLPGTLVFAGKDIGPHIDSEHIGKCPVSIHENTYGEGSVITQLAKVGTRDFIVIKDEYTRESWLKKHAASEPYTGRLIPGMKTILSHQIVAPEHNVYLGPTIHEFITESSRTWFAYSYSKQNS